MKTELQKKLFDKYPRLFKDKDLPMNQTCMCWGLECGDGWYEILDMLGHAIEEHFKNEKRNAEYSKDSKFSEEYFPRASQVKEKFGTLRFYTTYCEDYVDGAIRMAELMSAVTCEKCGNPGDVGNNSVGWIATLCKECRDD